MMTSLRLFIPTAAQLWSWYTLLVLVFAVSVVLAGIWCAVDTVIGYWRPPHGSPPRTDQERRAQLDALVQHPAYRNAFSKRREFLINGQDVRNR